MSKPYLKEIVIKVEPPSSTFCPVIIALYCDKLPLFQCLKFHVAEILVVTRNA